MLSLYKNRKIIGTQCKTMKDRRQTANGGHNQWAELFCDFCAFQTNIRFVANE